MVLSFINFELLLKYTENNIENWAIRDLLNILLLSEMSPSSVHRFFRIIFILNFWTIIVLFPQNSQLYSVNCPQIFRSFTNKNLFNSSLYCKSLRLKSFSLLWLCLSDSLYSVISRSGIPFSIQEHAYFKIALSSSVSFMQLWKH